MRWIAATTALMPVSAMTCLDHPQSKCGIGWTNVIGVLVTSCIVGWVTHQILDASGKHTPEGVAMLTAAIGLVGGPLIWFILMQF